MTAKEVRFETDARTRMMHGIDVLSNAVKATLGRAVLPLYAEAGVPLPQGEAGNAQPAPAPTE